MSDDILQKASTKKNTRSRSPFKFDNKCAILNSKIQQEIPHFLFKFHVANINLYFIRFINVDEVESEAANIFRSNRRIIETRAVLHTTHL